MRRPRLSAKVLVTRRPRGASAAPLQHITYPNTVLNQQDTLHQARRHHVMRMPVQDDHWPRAQRLHKQTVAAADLLRDELRSAEGRQDALEAALARAAQERAEREEQLARLRAAGGAAAERSAAAVAALKQEATSLLVRQRCCDALAFCTACAVRSCRRTCDGLSLCKLRDECGPACTFAYGRFVRPHPAPTKATSCNHSHLTAATAVQAQAEEEYQHHQQRLADITADAEAAKQRCADFSAATRDEMAAAVKDLGFAATHMTNYFAEAKCERDSFFEKVKAIEDNGDSLVARTTPLLGRDPGAKGALQGELSDELAGMQLDGVENCAAKANA